MAQKVEKKVQASPSFVKLSSNTLKNKQMGKKHFDSLDSRLLHLHMMTISRQ